MSVYPLGLLLIYVAGLFALVRFGDRHTGLVGRPRARSAIYLLGCCINWGLSACFGMIGLGASRDNLLIWAGAPIVFAMCPVILTRMARFAKKHKVTSIADYLAAYYGNAAPVASVAALICFISSIPVNALIINAVVMSMAMVTGEAIHPQPPNPYMSAAIAVIMTVFVIVIGTRHVDASGHRPGLALVTAVEIIMRMVAFILAGCFAVWGIFGGLQELLKQVIQDPHASAVLTAWPEAPVVSFTVSSMFGLLFIPAQFHMTIIENVDPQDLKRSAWAVPLIQLVMLVAALPVVIAGIVVLHDDKTGIDMAMITVPIYAHSGWITTIGEIAVFSSMASLVLVSTVSITIMVSNELVMPVVLRARFRQFLRHDRSDTRLLTIRRVTIAVTFALSCLCSWMPDEPAMPTLIKTAQGLFAQIVPCCLVTICFARADGRGAIAGIAAGVVTWGYAVAFPLLGARVPSLQPVLQEGLFGLAWLRPGALPGVDSDPFQYGSLWSGIANCAVFGLYATTQWMLKSRASPFAAVQSARADLAGEQARVKITLNALRDTVAHYLGQERTEFMFDAYVRERGLPSDLEHEADEAALLFGEECLAGGIGKAASRIVVSVFLKRQSFLGDDLLDDDLLDYGRQDQTGDHNFAAGQTLDKTGIAESRHAMSIFDRHLRLVAWNTHGLDFFAKLPSAIRPRILLADQLRYLAEHGFYGPGRPREVAAARLADLLDTSKIKRRYAPDGRIYDCRSLRLPDGSLVLHHIDVTDSALAEQTLEAHNETLEKRVRERTEELQRLNSDLRKAKAEAEAANFSKTRFLAAASHDLLQPLNAARLYATSLKDRVRAGSAGGDSLMLAINVEDSLEALEDILTALLDISHLDAGATKPEVTAFAIDGVFRQLQLEFEPTASQKGLSVTFVNSSLPILSDRRLLLRLLRNLISNAVKYTPKGRVIAGVRRRGRHASIEIWDTGLGIPKSKQRDIFREFERLPDAIQTAPGLGLGLSIVDRLSHVLGHEIKLRSKPGRGSVFSVLVPRATVLPQPFRARAARPSLQRSLDGLVVAAIDNEAAILEGMRALLGGWGCTVVAGEDLESLAAALQREALLPDVIIADYHLGATDGLAAIAALRQEYGECHAVLITADRGFHVREQARSMDVRFLNKPLKPAVLRSLLSQWRLVKQAAE